MKFEYKGTQLYYRVEGTGKPILILHGFSVDHHALYSTVEAVFTAAPESQYSRYYVDLPGMGRSRASDRLRNADDMLDILIQFTQQVIKESFHVISYSYGGYLSTGLLYNLGDNVLSAAFLAPVMIPDSHQRCLPNRECIKREIVSDYEPEIYASYCELAAVISQEGYHAFAQEIYPAFDRNDHSFLTTYQKRGYAFSYNQQLYQQCYRQPVLFIAAKEDDVVGYTDIKPRLSAFPNSQLHILKQAGHNLQLEKPREIQALLSSFFK